MEEEKGEVENRRGETRRRVESENPIYTHRESGEDRAQCAGDPPGRQNL